MACDLEWVGRHENVVVCGPSGTGKSMFLEALGHAVIDGGGTVTWINVEELGALVRAHCIDDTIVKATTPILRADLILGKRTPAPRHDRRRPCVPGTQRGPCRARRRPLRGCRLRARSTLRHPRLHHRLPVDAADLIADVLQSHVRFPAEQVHRGDFESGR